MCSALMNPRSSLPDLQSPTIGPYRKPLHSSSHFDTVFLEVPFWCYRLIYQDLRGLFPWYFQTKTYPSFPMHVTCISLLVDLESITPTKFCGEQKYYLVLYCVCFNLHCRGFKLFCNVCVCVCVCVWVGFVMCGCPDNVYSLNLFGYPDWGFSVLFPQL
jgi:hypothetical protein